MSVREIVIESVCVCADLHLRDGVIGTVLPKEFSFDESVAPSLGDPPRPPLPLLEGGLGGPGGHQPIKPSLLIRQ